MAGFTIQNPNALQRYQAFTSANPVTVTSQDDTVTVTPPEQSRTEQNRAEAEQRGNVTAAAGKFLESGVSPDGSPIKIEDYHRAVHAYERNIGPISEFIALDIQDALGQFTPDTIERAIKEAVFNGVRKWKYVKAILERWRVDGVPSTIPQPGRRSALPPWDAIGMTEAEYRAEWGDEEVDEWLREHAHD
jgi:DnaD/phage-associated family protein